VKKLDIYPSQITQWKKQMLSRILPNRINLDHSLANKHFNLAQLGANPFYRMTFDSNNLIFLD
jgi:hypothetical protein